jgi:predicted transcriptional regulator
MKAYLRRRLRPDELLERIGELEAEGRREEALRLAAAYAAYEEEGESPVLVEEELPLEVARRLLSNRITELISYVKRAGGKSVSELARELGRSPSNVYADVAFLSRYNVIYLERQGRRVVVHPLAEEIRIEL